jgi:segregation and condensation protein A
MNETKGHGTNEGFPGAAAAPGDGVMRFRVGEFEGPLDLLLHLVRINEVDITNLPIVEITRQYQEALDWMRTLDLEVAGEYLVMAATLLHIKSRMLLPADPVPEGEEAADPRHELAQQLLEYQRFKQVAETLQAMDAARALVWTRDGTVPEEFAGEELLKVELFDLLSAFKTLLGRLDEEVRLHLRRDNISVAEKITWLTDLLERRSSVDLLEVLAELPTRIDRIAAFLGLLEMIRLRLVVAFQRTRLGEIRIALRRESEGAAGADVPEPLDGGAS